MGCFSRGRAPGWRTWLSLQNPVHRTNTWTLVEHQPPTEGKAATASCPDLWPMNLWTEIWGRQVSAVTVKGHFMPPNQEAQEGGRPALRSQHQLGSSPGPTIFQAYGLEQVPEALSPFWDFGVTLL